MKNVVIISTEHVESGKCNSDELFKIVEPIKPEIIFEEEPNDDHYKSYYTDQKKFKPLEIQTIIKYKQYHNILNIPIDKQINEYASLYLLDILSEVFKRHQNYQTLIKEHCSLRDKNGFEYLNSKQCSEINAKKLLLEKQIISNSGHVKDELTNFYNLFHQEVNAREVKMLENIYEFTKSNNFYKAVFFLGYAHRESIRQQISKYELLNNIRISWTLYNEYK
jgi:hypothetical protein